MLVRDLVVLDDGTLRAMASDARFTREFPFLASLARPRHSCGRCGRARAGDAADVAALGAARRSLTELPKDKKKKLLSLLNARQLRVRYRDGNRTVVKTIRSDAPEQAGQ